MPAIYVIPSTSAVEAGDVVLSQDHIADWRAFAAAKDAVGVVDITGRVVDTEFAKRKVAGRSVWTHFPLYRIDEEFKEPHVVAELLAQAPKGTRRDFCARIGVSQSMITKIAVGDRRPSSLIARALGYLRVPGTYRYIRRLDWQTGWDSDTRGGRGGTRPAVQLDIEDLEPDENGVIHIDRRYVPVGFEVGMREAVERMRDRGLL